MPGDKSVSESDRTEVRRQLPYRTSCSPPRSILHQTLCHTKNFLFQPNNGAKTSVPEPTLPCRYDGQNCPPRPLTCERILFQPQLGQARQLAQFGRNRACVFIKAIGSMRCPDLAPSPMGGTHRWCFSENLPNALALTHNMKWSHKVVYVRELDRPISSM